MKTIRIRYRGKSEQSEVRCRKHGFSRDLPKYVKEYQQVMVFTDSNVFALYGRKMRKVLGTVPVYTMPAGEENKTPETLFALLRAMAGAGLHRGACLIALGGGVVGDIGGLASALYMRGIDCIQVPTTLLSQVDSSVGGKTAVDLDGVKNLVGAFHQPQKVVVDGDFLSTLPRREIRCGLGEIVKHGALNGELFDLLWEKKDRLFDLEFLAEIIPLNIEHKASVVRADEKEAGLRKSLNLGHTTAHAFELCDGALSHGEYVLIGMTCEAELAKKYLSCDVAYLEQLKSLCTTALEGVKLSCVDGAARFASLDKKNQSNGMITLTVPRSRGEYALLELPFEAYEREIDEIVRGLQLC